MLRYSQADNVSAGSILGFKHPVPQKDSCTPEGFVHFRRIRQFNIVAL